MGITANPFLSEFDTGSFMGRLLRSIPLAGRLLTDARDKYRVRLAAAAAGAGFLACVLSAVSGAGRIVVDIRKAGAPSPDRIGPFGYLYEYNSGLLYLLGVPIFILVAFVSIHNAHLAFEGLIRQRRIRISADPRKHDPIGFLAEGNRRMFRPWALFAILLFNTSIVLSTEIHDYGRLAFGWVQSPAIPAYARKAPDELSLAELGEQRELRAVARLPDPAAWKVEAVTGGTREEYQKILFWPFLVLALGLQILFMTFAMWLALKLFYILLVVARCLAWRGTPWPAGGTWRDATAPA